MDNAIWFYLGYQWFNNKDYYNKKVMDLKITLICIIGLLYAQYFINYKGITYLNDFAKIVGIFSGGILSYQLAIKLSNTVFVNSNILNTFTKYSMEYIYILSQLIT